MKTKDTVMPESLKNHGSVQLSKAVQRMRDACENADRLINEDRHDIGKARAVLHEFVWAWANAQMDIEACLAHVERWLEQ